MDTNIIGRELFHKDEVNHNTWDNPISAAEIGYVILAVFIYLGALYFLSFMYGQFMKSH